MNTYCTSFFFRKRIKEKWKKRKIYIYRSEGRSWSLNDLIKSDIMGVSHYDTKVMITLKSLSFCQESTMFPRANSNFNDAIVKIHSEMANAFYIQSTIPIRDVLFICD